jgi:dethiobiotin synthetase
MVKSSAVSLGLFVTGTDTGVGKTVVSAALMQRYRSAARLRYWKPVQTGIEQDDDTAEVERLGSCDPDEVEREGIRLCRPVSPHLAAKESGTTIVLAPLVNRIRDEGVPDTGRHDSRIGWIVEGAGGLLVPLNETETNADFIAALGLPALIVARSALGTINHTLLTLEALRHRQVPIAGVVMVGDPDRENRAAIETYGDVAVIGELPRLSALERRETDPEGAPVALARWAEHKLDPEGRLLEWLRGAPRLV